jgi:hypothetical protein
MANEVIDVILFQSFKTEKKIIIIGKISYMKVLKNVIYF